MLKSFPYTSPTVVFTFTAIVLVTLFGNNLHAQSTDAGVEVTRDGTDLRFSIDDPGSVLNALNTAVVFTNQSNNERRVWCRAWNARGEQVGRAWTKMPSQGTRVIFASDMTDLPFLGKITCTANVTVHASSFIFGNEFSQSDVSITQHLNLNQFVVHAAVLH